MKKVVAYLLKTRIFIGLRQSVYKKVVTKLFINNLSAPDSNMSFGPIFHYLTTLHQTLIYHIFFYFY